MIQLSANLTGPVAIRYPRHLLPDDISFQGKWNTLGEHCGKIKLLCVGPRALKNARQLQSEHVQIVNVTTAKELDDDFISTIKPTDTVITIEENVLSGGFGSMVQNALANVGCQIYRFGVDDQFVSHATVDQQLAQFKIDNNSLQNFISKLL